VPLEAAARRGYMVGLFVPAALLFVVAAIFLLLARRTVRKREQNAGQPFHRPFVGDNPEDGREGNPGRGSQGGI